MRSARSSSASGSSSAAEELIDEAIRTTKLSIGDLRALVRGMRPAILSDRGLDAALSALVSSSAVPVRLVNEVSDRADVTTELVVYFAVAESVTNAMKHSGATNIDVRIWRSEHGLRADIRDNGHGGAQLTPGGGLQGVRERVAAAGGSMVFSSPAGGPTEIEVMVPCAS
ncbi:sensor histidine kinase [Gulosibacter sediminis]|uniref:sensor histidine kinase n=1 Tax=Gulosibacter sediminis TaxID=1729695 RepID=UPI0024ACEF5A|nr:ATP-binding protein [Gulosibacter sediminis]